jgi:hypothetical protein
VARKALAMAGFGASMHVELSFSYVESMLNFWLPRPFFDMGRQNDVKTSIKMSNFDGNVLHTTSGGARDQVSILKKVRHT